MGHPSRRPACLLVLLVTLSALASPTLAEDRDVTTETGLIVARTVVVPAPAVAERSDGTLTGLTTTLEITIRNGTGNVFMDTRPLAQLDMQGSARIAASIAATVAGVAMERYDFFITMRAASPIIGGPSAGGTMAVAFTSLLAGWPLRDDVLMTGMINPDGTIGPVGGIFEKADAARRAGATLFLIPEGQAIVTRTVQYVVEEGGVQRVESRQEQVDVREHARREWGLTVREVVDVHAAIENFTGVRLIREVPDGEIDYPLFVDVMGRASLRQLEEARAEYRQALDAVADAGLDAAGRAETRESLERLLAAVSERLDRADTAATNASFYTASSLVFQSRIDLRKVDLILGAIEAGDQYTYLVGRAEDIERDLGEARAEAAAVVPRTITGLEGLGAAQVRAMESGTLLARAQQQLQAGALLDAVDLLAFSAERIRSVRWWLDLTHDLDLLSDGPALDTDPSLLVRDTVSAALQSVTYAQVLLSQTGGSATTTSLLEEAGVTMEEALTARELDLDAGAIYLALEAQVQAHAALSLVGGDALLDARVERQRDRALIEIERTRAAGVEPILAVSYVDFATSLVRSNPRDALVLFGFAATIARTSALLTEAGPCGFSGDCAPQVVFPSSADETWWTRSGVVAVAGLVGGFLAGALVTRSTRGPRPRRQAVPRPATAAAPAAPGPVVIRRRSRAAHPPGARPHRVGNGHRRVTVVQAPRP